jgi:hypothetical protein
MGIAIINLDAVAHGSSFPFDKLLRLFIAHLLG